MSYFPFEITEISSEGFEVRVLGMDFIFVKNDNDLVVFEGEEKTIDGEVMMLIPNDDTTHIDYNEILWNLRAITTSFKKFKSILFHGSIGRTKTISNVVGSIIKQNNTYSIIYDERITKTIISIRKLIVRGDAWNH
ncbi:unnamed protein product [Rhizophagus irregularis]|nr:unnamed protein product [Rhizophagus irregularis]